MNNPLQGAGTFIRNHRRETIIVAVAFLVLLWTFWPTLAYLADRWSHDSQYSHGFLVPLFAAYLLFVRRDQLEAPDFGPSWWGLPLLVFALVVHFAGSYLFITWLHGLALLPCVAGLFILAGGRRAFLWAWPAIAFLVFMVPMSHRLQSMLAGPLQRFGTIASTYILQTIGYTVSAEGNIIHMGQVKLGVVEACSGLSMLISFVALCSAAAIVIRRPWLDKLIIFVSSVPIAIACNIARIVVTAILHKVAGPKLADLIFHDLAGWLMMPLALIMLWLELKLISSVLIVPKPNDAPPVVPRGGFVKRKRTLSRAT